MTDKTIYIWDNISFFTDEMNVKSDRALAKKIGVNHSSISKYRETKGIPSLKIILKLSELFGTTIDELIHVDMKEQRIMIDSGAIVLNEIEAKSIKRKIFASLEAIENKRVDPDQSVVLPKLINNSTNVNTVEF